MVKGRSLGGVAFALAVTTAVGALGLDVASMAPQGKLEGREVQRIQIVFSSPVVPLSEARPLRQPPPWLSVTPPILARWRWAGTAELIGEPLAPLPRATSYEVRVDGSLTAVDGSTLGREAIFAFTTPLPLATMMKDTTGEADAFPIVLTFNQPVDPGSLPSRLQVRIAPNPLDAIDAEIAAAQSRRLQGEDAKARAEWERFLALARGAQPTTPDFTLEADPERPHEVFFVRPVGCWPPAANVEVTVAPGVRSLEGPLPSDRPLGAVFQTPWPFGPVRFAGRPSGDGAGLEPESVQLVFSSEVTWRDIAPHLTYRQVGETSWRTVAPFAEEWAWEWEETELSLAPLGLEGGRRYEVCLDADTVDARGRRLGFPWCGTFATSHHAPVFRLVEGDGVVEWQGPHLLPLRVRNVTRYRLELRRIAEEELVPLLAAREERAAEGLSRPVSVAVDVPADRSAVLPVDLDPALGGRPGLVLTRVQVESVVDGSEYDQDEAGWLRAPRASVTQVTSLGLTVKGSRHEGLLVWVTELQEPRPAAGVTVTVRGRSNDVLWRGSTDERGLARTPQAVSLEQAFLVTARRGDDLAYARTSWWEGHRGWEFNLPVDYDVAPPVLAHVWSDRGVVRPGESLHLKAVARRQEERSLALPAAGPFTFVVRGPDGEDAVVAETTYDPRSGAEAEIRLPASAPLGAYEVMVGSRYDRDRRAFADDGAWNGECSFRVAEFRRPKFRVTAAVERDLLQAGDPLAGSAEARLLAGGAMAGADARWSVKARREDWRPAGERWAGFETLPAAFLDEEDGAQPVAMRTTRLDETGRLSVTLPRVEAIKGWPARLDLQVEVTDVDRQSAAATASVTVLPGEFVLGVRRPPFFVRASDGVATAVVALAPDGTPRAGVSVDVVLLRRHWESVRRREVSGRYVFESRPVVEEVARTQLVTARDPVPARFELAAGGEYALAARATDGRGNPIEASTAFYVFGSGFAPWRFDQENRIELVPERERWAAGETARILVKSPWERALALVTVERAGVLEERIEELSGTMPTVSIPIRSEYVPNVFVSVVLLRGRVEAPQDPELVDPGRPAYRVGYCELTVPPQGKRLAVAIATDQGEYRPGRQAEVTVKVAGADGAPRAAAVTLWAVDAGVLALTGYRTPDLLATFYARRGLGVTTAESRSRLVGRRSYGTKGDKPGGGGGVEIAGEQVRRDFRAVAFWEGTVLTDASGRAVVRVTLPDSLTTYRVMAVATAGTEEFGAAEREFLVTKPVGLEPALPRFLRPGDKVRAGVVVRNRTAAEREVEVTLTLPGGSPVELRGTASRVTRVPAGGSAEVGFGLVALAPGTATMTFAARSAMPTAESDAVEFALPVLPVQPVETVATFFATTGDAREVVAVPTDAFPSSGGLTVRLASTALVEAGGGVRFLEGYPYACSEQVAARVLGMAAAQRLGPGFAPATVDGTPLQRWLAEAVALLAERQRSDGGFAFWPGGASFEELSAFVCWALVAAQQAGAPVDRKVLDAAGDYLSRSLRHDRRRWGEGHDWTARVLLSFGLQQLGRAEPAYFQALFDRRREAGSLWGRALLAATMLAVDRRDPRAAALLQEVRNALVVEARAARLEEPVPEWGWWVLWSEPRSSAAALLALLAADPRDPVTERLARGLLDHLGRDRFRTTHDTAWMLQALARYRERHEGGLARGSVHALLAGGQLLAGQFTGRAAETLTATVPMEELQRRVAASGGPLPLEVRLDGEGTLHGAAELAYAARQGDRPPVAQGLGLARRILDAAGQDVRRVAAGEEVMVELTVTCSSICRFVVADVPIPAGLEAVDPGLATTWADEAETADDGTLWQPGFERVELRDDRIVAFATELPPGRHSHTVRCRATTAGTFVVAPGKAEQMYAPEVFGTTAADTFEVTPRR